MTKIPYNLFHHLMSAMLFTSYKLDRSVILNILYDEYKCSPETDPVVFIRNFFKESEDMYVYKSFTAQSWAEANEKK